MKFKRVLVSAIVVGVLFAFSARAAEVFDIDSAHSLVGFEITHMMINDVEGKFKEFNGQLTWDAADPSKSAISGTIKTQSISTDNEKRDEHLRSPDFFDAAKFPDISFKTNKIEKRGEGYVGTGELTMHGVTKPVEIPFAVTEKLDDPFGNTRIGLKGALNINRKDFGITWNKALDKGGMLLGDEVRITLKAEGIMKK
jgi:polyisoprenoid-binding protein YceI